MWSEEALNPYSTLQCRFEVGLLINSGSPPVDGGSCGFVEVKLHYPLMWLVAMVTGR